MKRRSISEPPYGSMWLRGIAVERQFLTGEYIPLPRSTYTADG